MEFSAMLLEKNKVMNLTAVTEPAEVVTRHFLDCAALAPLMPQGGSVLDVGTGAGFPGMPLAILCPGTEFVLLDALRKRVDFLNEVIDALGLTNCTAVHARAEEFAAAHRERFDAATSRAVAELRTLCEFALADGQGGRYVLCDESRGLRRRDRGGRQRDRGAGRGGAHAAALHRAARRGGARDRPPAQDRPDPGAVPPAVQENPVRAAVRRLL